MNKQHLYTAGSLLLATTALTSAASAGTFVKDSTYIAGTTTFGSATAFKSVKVANTVFSTTAATANAVVLGPINDLAVSFANQYTGTTKFSIEIDPVGALFLQASVTPNLLISGNNSFETSITAATAGCNVTPLTTKILIQNCDSVSVTTGTGAGNVSAQYIGVSFPGLQFNNASGLAVAGGTISLSGQVTDAGGSGTVFETITAATVVTSAAPLSAIVTPAVNQTAASSATPVAFDYFSGTQGGLDSGILTMVLATIGISGTGVTDGSLSTLVSADGTGGTTTAALSSINVTVTDTLLTSGALSGAVGFTANSGGTQVTSATAAAFAGGSATFSINAAAGAFTNITINLMFNGTTAIPAAGAGVVTVVLGGATAASVQALGTVTGVTAALSLGGFHAELNTFLGSSNTSFSSYIRIHNNGAIAGVASIAVKNDASGVTLGTTYTTAAIAAGETLQLSAAQIETGAGITPALGLNYTLDVAGPITGYVQHIIFNPATGQLADLSGFRNNGSGFTSLSNDP
jgi:hypothetical protein